MLVALRLFLLLATLFGAVAACANDPAECPEPCLAGQRCYYGACIPIHDAGDEDGTGD
ncbi:MAG: hypothetical protein JXB32_07815 [Deltaproteobacteria bacterium]|nr:hypothetical protein [Deltaproteobacteria bacterium]